MRPEFFNRLKYVMYFLDDLGIGFFIHRKIKQIIYSQFWHLVGARI